MCARKMWQFHNWILAHQLLNCALRWKDCDTSSFPLSLLREGPGGWSTDAPVALCEALYIALTEGRPFPEAPIQARAAAASAEREYRFSKPDLNGGIGRKMSYQGKKNIPKITVSKNNYLCLSGCGNFDARCCRTLLSVSLPFHSGWWIANAYIWSHIMARGLQMCFSIVRLDCWKKYAPWNGMTGCHSDSQAERWGVFLKVSCIFFVEGIHACGEPARPENHCNAPAGTRAVCSAKHWVNSDPIVLNDIFNPLYLSI